MPVLYFGGKMNHENAFNEDADTAASEKEWTPRSYPHRDSNPGTMLAYVMLGLIALFAAVGIWLAVKS